MPLALRTVCLAILLFLVSPVDAGQQKNDTAPSVTELLRLDRVGIGRRSTVNTDAIEMRVATGTLTAPEAGDEVEAPDGWVHVWEPFEADEEGNYPPIGGGWLYASVSVEEDSTWLLRGRGYRHVYVNGEPRVGDLYSLGINTLPVRLRAGENRFLFKSGRGRFVLEFQQLTDEERSELHAVRKKLSGMARARRRARRLLTCVRSRTRR